jgi:hypothetical protein
MCSQLLEAASIFEVYDLSCTERVELAGPSSDLVEYLHTFADVYITSHIYYLRTDRSSISIYFCHFNQ